jgi:hypothetical protein
VGSLSQFKEYAGPLLRGQLSAGEGISGIRFFKGIENADYLLHNSILRRFPSIVAPARPDGWRSVNGRIEQLANCSFHESLANRRSSNLARVGLGQ